MRRLQVVAIRYKSGEGRKQVSRFKRALFTFSSLPCVDSAGHLERRGRGGIIELQPERWPRDIDRVVDKLVEIGVPLHAGRSERLPRTLQCLVELQPFTRAEVYVQIGDEQFWLGPTLEWEDTQPLT